MKYTLSQEAIKKISTILDYNFKNTDLISIALTHTSMSKYSKQIMNYERLEFLGDAIITAIISDLLYRTFSQEKEGDLAKRRSELVNGERMAEIANKLKLNDYIIMTDSEKKAKTHENKRVMEDILESITGAIYYDGGFEAAEKFVVTHWVEYLDQESIPPISPKAALQEWAQKKGIPIPIYKLINTEGEAHNPTFTIKVEVKNLPPISAKDKNKKAAENVTASALLQYIEKNNIL